jgi:hypothetical protein
MRVVVWDSERGGGPKSAERPPPLGGLTNSNKTEKEDEKDATGSRIKACIPRRRNHFGFFVRLPAPRHMSESGWCGVVSEPDDKIFCHRHHRRRHHYFIDLRLVRRVSVA